MYITVSIGPSHMESRMGFSKAPPTALPHISPLNTLSALPYISLKKHFLLLPPYFFFIRTLQAPSKRHATGFRQVLKSLCTRYSLFFRFKQNSPFGGSPIFSSLWNLPKCTCSFNRPWCSSLSNHNRV